MSAAAEFRQALILGDWATCARAWVKLNPGLPIPSKLEAQKIMHLARTAANSIPLDARAYSHRWCLDMGLPSQLPDNLKPKAERLYPNVVEVVAVMSMKPHEPLNAALNGAAMYAVRDALAMGDDDPALLRRLQAEARKKERRVLLGRG